MTIEENRVASGWISFGQVEIDLAGRRLFVDGNAVSLEPKAFAVLAMLAQQPGRAFTRDEILDAVWGHRHVTPGVLNRVIVLIRQAFGETAEQTRYLHTVHGVGYRLDAPARFTGQRAPAEPVGAAVAEIPPVAPPPLVEAGKKTLPTLPGPISGQADHATQPSLPAATTHNAFRWFWAAAFALLALFAFVTYRLQTAEPTKPGASAAPTLIVLPLSAVDSNHDESVLADGLSEELITRLARAEGLRVISSTSARLAREQHLDPAELAQRTGTTHALEGSLREAGDALRIDLRLIETPSGRTLWAQEYDRKLVDVFAMQSEIAQAVAAALAVKLGLPEKPEGGVDMARYREYLELRAQLYAVDSTMHGKRSEDARAALRALVAREPDNARPFGLLARALASGREWHTMNPFPGAIEEAGRDAARALALDPDNVDAHVALAGLACHRGDWDTCMAQARQVLALDPVDVYARSFFAARLADLGYLDEARREAEASVRSDPLVAGIYGVLGRISDTQGRHDEAQRALETGARLDTNVSATLVYATWFNAYWRHDYAAAEALAERMPEQDGWRESFLAVARAHGDPQLWPALRPLIEASETRTGHYNFLRWLQADVDLRDAFAHADTPLHNGIPSYFLLVWQPEYARMRRDPAFQDFLKRNGILDYWRAHGFPPQCTPDGDGAKCD